MRYKRLWRDFKEGKAHQCRPANCGSALVNHGRRFFEGLREVLTVRFFDFVFLVVTFFLVAFFLDLRAGLLAVLLGLRFEVRFLTALRRDAGIAAS